MRETLNAVADGWAEHIERIYNGKRHEMIQRLIEEKKFNPTSAAKAIDNFIKTVCFVEREKLLAAMKASHSGAAP